MEIKIVLWHTWASIRENSTLMYANDKDADQPVHPSCLVNDFAIRFLGSILCKITNCKISMS